MFESYISLHGCNTKNKKDESVTIPNEMARLLITHLQDAKNEDYLFSSNKFAPGPTQLTSKKVTTKWNEFRTKHSVNMNIQFYSLKDTGITDLLNSGVPSIKVRDQARHYDLKITEKYIARNDKSDEVVKNSVFSF